MRFAICTFLLLASWGCGDSDHGPTMMAGPGMAGPGATGPQGQAPALVSVAPRGQSTGVSITEPIVLHFGAAMAGAMEQYVDLHVGTIAGPVVPIACGFSPDRTTLTCVPNGPLAPRTTYVLHVGGGMMTGAGQPIDYGTHGPGMGGLWLTGGTMGPAHAGHGWGMMGPGWRHSNGSYGMEFSFTTA